MFYVYILRCNDGSYYTGHTDNIEARVSQHQQSLIKDCYTITRLPVTIVFVQQFFSREAAFIAERKIKGWSRRKKEALMKGDWKEIIRLSNEKKDPSTSSG
ncbi:MAG: GIY-YIG nuclease family protein [bacterium]